MGFDFNQSRKGGVAKVKKIKVEVCSGTQCVMMGAMDIVASIQSLSSLKQQLRMDRKIEIVTSKCFGLCKEGKCGPFVRVDGELIENADSESVMSHIISIVSQKGEGC